MIVYESILGNDIKLFSTMTCRDRPSLSWSAMKEFVSIVSGEDALALPDWICNIHDALGCSKSSWPVLMSDSSRSTLLESQKKVVDAALQSASAYYDVWFSIRVFLDTLGDVRVDNKRFVEFLGKKRDGYFSRNQINGRVKYSTSGTATGRLTITSGPNFLVLPRDTRRSLQRTFPNSSIYSIDFTSLEPRVALWTSSKNVSEEDVYVEVMKACGIEDRSIAKLATLSSLYGAGIHRLASTVGNRRQAKRLIKKVADYFDVRGLESKFEEEASSCIMKNCFGRPLHEATKNPRVRLNHYIQSSAAELAVVLFSRLCEKHPEVKPLLVIHDALIVEVPDSCHQDFLDSCRDIRYNGFWFPTKQEIMDI